MSPKIVDKKAKRKQIAEAAITIYAKKGVKNTRIIDIAEKAGIGKGTVYEYFRSHDEILVECFSLIMTEMDVEARHILSEQAGPEIKLKEILKTTWSSLSKYPADFLSIFLDFWAEGIRRPEGTDGLYTQLKSFYHQYRNQFSRILEDGVKQGCFKKIDTVAVASILMSIIDGLLLQIIIDRNAFDKEKIIDSALDMFLEGIKAHPSANRL